MNSSELASGDSGVSPQTSPRKVETDDLDAAHTNCLPKDTHGTDHDIEGQEEITTQAIDDNESQLKARIDQCKNIIESLKLQLSEEKAKIQTKKKPEYQFDSCQLVSEYYSDATMYLGNTSMYSSCVDSKLCCDENLIEYEKQLQKYQNTLSLAQNEKKNAIHKQMIAKAFKLKLMEVENQCNIELIRVKQSLQCLEPLQMIANKWKTNAEETLYDVNSYDLMPNFLELKAHSVSDVNSCKEEPTSLVKDDLNLSE